MLASHSSTARFLATKLVRRFVADDPPTTLVDEVAGTYRKTDGDIKAMLRTIFYSREFWSRDAYQTKTRKPLELVAGTVRALGAELEPTPMLIAAMERMGEPLYMCQPPTGYPDVGEEWLNTGTLLYRWKFALGAATGAIAGIRAEIPSDLAGQEAPEILDRFSRAFSQAELSERTRAKLEQMASEQLAKRPDPEAPLGEREVRYLAGLVLGSPEFQWR
jgi:uncharacterized protein (DUF1800 family)